MKVIALKQGVFDGSQFYNPGEELELGDDHAAFFIGMGDVKKDDGTGVSRDVNRPNTDPSPVRPPRTSSKDSPSAGRGAASGLSKSKPEQ